MKFASLLLVALLTLATFATAGVVDRRVAGPPGQRVTVTRGDLVFTAGTADAPGTDELLVAPPPPDTVHVRWRSGGLEVDVAISRQPGESNPGMAVRLAGLVNEMKVSFPVDPPTPPSGG